ALAGRTGASGGRTLGTCLRDHCKRRRSSRRRLGSRLVGGAGSQSGCRQGSRRGRFGMDRRADPHSEAPRQNVKTLRVLREAEEELAEAAEWYESKRAGLGIELVASVDRAFDEIRDAPLS